VRRLAAWPSKRLREALGGVECLFFFFFHS
jgi:hypothetical protein